MIPALFGGMTAEEAIVLLVVMVAAIILAQFLLGLVRK